MNSNATTGKLVLNDGHSVYEGEIIDGKPNGRGLLRWDDGENWEGMFVDGVPNGQCRRFWDDGMYVEGVFKNAQPVGDVKLYQPGVGLFEGPFDGNGVCTMTYPDGSRYEGECSDRMPNGWGKRVTPGLSEIEGEWRGGDPHGYSVMKVSDARAAQVGAQAGWTAEGVITQGVQRKWWIRTANGKSELLRADDGNFDIPQEDLPLSLKARLFLGFVEMYRERIPNKLENQVIRARIWNEIAQKSNKMKALLNGSTADQMRAVQLHEQTQIEIAELKDQIDKIDRQEEEWESLSKELLALPIEAKADEYYKWLLAGFEVAETAENYACMAEYFSNISEYKDCAMLAEKCKTYY